jgi:cardiolipin synthase
MNADAASAWTLHPAIVLGEFALQLFVAGLVLVRKGRRPTVAMAWIVAVMAIPVAGLVTYFLVGESNFGNRRAARHARILAEVDRPERHAHRDPRSSEAALASDQAQLARMAESVSHGPVLAGNLVDLSGDSAANVEAMARDIEAARSHAHLLTYIYLLDAAGARIARALLSAARRGVEVRLLVDGVGSKDFLRSELRRTLEAGGVRVAAALPVTLFRMAFARLDIRNHRKLLVVDGEIAWVGSQNIAEASFAPKARYAPWVDCMLRIRGPLVRELQLVFVEDWYMEREEDLDAMLEIEPPFEPEGVAAQAVATGPNFRNDAMASLLQASVHLARGEIVLTTPYFVPDLAMQSALAVAARRGVRVHLVVPRRNDSWLVQRASRAFYDELLDAGVTIHEFTGGLLHAKTLVVDDLASVVTSANLDRRSFEINFEMGVLVYDAAFCARLRALQQSYIDRSVPVDRQAWESRPLGRRLAESAAGLLSPLL